MDLSQLSEQKLEELENQTYEAMQSSESDDDFLKLLERVGQEKKEEMNITNETPIDKEGDEIAQPEDKSETTETTVSKTNTETTTSPTDSNTSQIESDTQTQPEEKLEMKEVELDDNDKQFVLAKSYEYFANDPKVKQIINELGLKVPTNRDEWKALYEEDGFAYNEVLSRFNQIHNTLLEEARKVKNEYENYPITFNQNVEEIVGKVKAVVDKVAGKDFKISEKQVKEIGDKMQQYWDKHKDKFTINKNGLKYIDSERFVGNFIADNPDTLIALKSVPKTEEKTKQKGGEEITSLLTKGISSTGGKTVNLKDVAALTEEQLLEAEEKALKSLDNI